MKRLILLLAAVALLSVTNKTEAGIRVSFDFFYSSLQPHGSWITMNDGLVVWRPYFRGAQWSPYSVGRWIYTDYGWYWDSEETYGHIVYHYGRWHFDNYYGWIWMPDYDWAPAWVEWRYDSDYICWAPLSPYASWSVNYGIRYNRRYHANYWHWNIVKANHFNNNSIHKYRVRESESERIYNRTKVRNDFGVRGNTFVNNGLDRSFVERTTGTSVRTRDIDFTRERVENNVSENERVRVYRPEERDGNTREDLNRYNFERSERSADLDRDALGVRERVERETPRATETTRSEVNTERTNREQINRNGSSDSNREQSREVTREPNREQNREVTREPNREQINRDGNRTTPTPRTPEVRERNTEKPATRETPREAPRERSTQETNRNGRTGSQERTTDRETRTR